MVSAWLQTVALFPLIAGCFAAPAHGPVTGEPIVLSRVIFEEWNAIDNPQLEDANAVGPAIEFGMETPLGYDAARPGESFVKIGVGELIRAEEKPYFFRDGYEVKSSAETWTEKFDRSSYRATQRIRTDRFSYDLTQTIRVDRDRFVLSCRLVNRGEELIDADVYPHNFFRLNGAGWREGMTVCFDASVEDSQARQVPESPRRADESSFVTGRDLNEGEAAWLPLKSSAENPARSFTISDETLRLIASHDFRPYEFVIFGLADVVCVETFHSLSLAPGESAEWSYTYRLEMMDDR